MNIMYSRLLCGIVCVLTASAVFAQTSVNTSFGSYGFEEGQTITKIQYDKNVTLTFTGVVTYSPENSNGYIKVSKGATMNFEFSSKVKSVRDIEFYTSSSKDKDVIFSTVEPKWDGYLTTPEKGYAYFTGESTYISLYLLKWISDDFSPTGKLTFTTGSQFNLFNLTVNYDKKYTGITDAEVDTAVSVPVYYNLQGQRVEHPRHGAIYMCVDSDGATKIIF